MKYGHVVQCIFKALAGMPFEGMEGRLMNNLRLRC